MTMQQQPTGTAVRASITVDAPVERAFTVFTDDIDSWWNPDHHIIEAPLDKMVFEPRAGGRIVDVGTDGSECPWSRVLVYEPPTRVVFSWDINLQWKLETDPSKASEIEVTFTPEGPERTRVELEHRHLDRHGDGWEAMRDAIGSPGGWDGGLELFAKYLRGA
jgi:uncharacterized protein YndB with AHSA1/START domain